MCCKRLDHYNAKNSTQELLSMAELNIIHNKNCLVKITYDQTYDGILFEVPLGECNMDTSVILKDNERSDMSHFFNMSHSLF